MKKPHMMDKELIFLIGFMGSGKTSLGKRMAKMMGYSFMDSDKEIVRIENRSISTIFSEDGEEAFRELESNWLKTLEGSKKIIAVGGGTPCFNNNIDLMLSRGKVIYIKMPPKLLVERLQKSKNIRPLIEPIKEDKTALLKFVENKLKERLKFYERAHLQLSGVSVSADKLKEIVDQLKST